MLLTVDASDLAFTLSQEYLFAAGLMKSYLQDSSEQLTQRLVDIVSKHGNIHGSASKSLALEILEDLESFGAETAPLILRIGSSCPLIFEGFLEV